jgi:hypothetical protein
MPEYLLANKVAGIKHLADRVEPEDTAKGVCPQATAVDLKQRTVSVAPRAFAGYLYWYLEFSMKFLVQGNLEGRSFLFEYNSELIK